MLKKSFNITTSSINKDIFSKNLFNPKKPLRDYDKEMTAAERFGGRNLKGLPRLGSGRDREVFALDKDKVLKMAKNPGGLTQNTGERDLQYLDMGTLHEQGKDYVVMKRQQPLSKEGKQKLAAIRKVASEHSPMSPSYRTDVSSDLSREDSPLHSAGIGTDILDFQPNPQEVFANRQWGEDDEGNLVLLDGGALQDDVSLRRYRVKDFEQVRRMDPEREPWQLKDWREVQRDRQQFRDKGNYIEQDEQSKDMRFDGQIRQRYPKETMIVWTSTDKALKDHSIVDGDDYDITIKRNQIGNRLENAQNFISTKEYQDEYNGGFEPPLVNTKGSVTDGRHRLLALKNLGYTEIPLEVIKK